MAPVPSYRALRQSVGRKGRRSPFAPSILFRWGTIVPQIPRESLSMPSDTGERPRVGLVSDLALVRDALAMQLVRDPHIILVGASTLGAPLPSDADGRGVEVVVLDFGSIGARAWVERMRTAPHCPGLVGIAISKSAIPLSGWAEAGVCGFVEDDGNVEDVVSAILLVAQGRFCCSPRAAASIVSGLIDRERPALPHDVRARLTPRETEILRNLAHGSTNKEIARRLGISGATVKNHVHRLFEKLDVTRRAEAAVLARAANF